MLAVPPDTSGYGYPSPRLESVAPMGEPAHIGEALAPVLGAGELERIAAHRRRASPVDPDDPTSLDRAAAVVWHDETVVDGFLLSAGLRYDLLRRLPRAVRFEWWRELRAAVLPPGTRVCWEGAVLWLDEVERRLAAQNWQDRRLQRWRKFADLVARSCARNRRPITGRGLTLPELAEALGITTRRVTTIIRWYRDQGLLRVVMPGARSVHLDVPTDELGPKEPERTTHQARAALAHAERRRLMREWVEDELDAVREGRTAPPPPDELAVFREHLGDLLVFDESRDLTNVAQVYELLVPEAPDVREAPPQRARSQGVADLATARQRRAQRQRGRLDAVPAQPGRAAVLGGVDQGRTGAGRPSRSPGSPSICTESSTLTAVDPEREIVTTTSGVVDERRPSGGSYEKDSHFPEGPNHTPRRLSPPLRAAWRLLGGAEQSRAEGPGVLPRQLRQVKPLTLARLVGPYVAAGWTDEQLVAVLAYRGGAWSYVPPVIDNPAGWLVAALRRRPPTAPPTADEMTLAHQRAEVREDVADVEAVNTAAATSRAAKLLAVMRACELCDDNGLRPLDGDGPPIRCRHSPADADEVAAALAAAAEDRLTRDEAREVIARTLTPEDPVRAALLAEARRRWEERKARQLADPNHVPRALRKQVRRTWRKP